MAVYAIGDIQGCFDELQALLALIKFNPAKDQLWFTGDLVNRGPKSLETLRFVKGLGESAVTVLGNHDLHLLAVAYGHGKKLAKDTLKPILKADDGEALIHWLRHRPIMHYDKRLDTMMVHAGLPPQWDLNTAKTCARELEAVLRGDDYMAFIANMYGNRPKRWKKSLKGMERLRFITNAFSRTRYCHEDGALDFDAKGKPGRQAAGLLPWFEVPGRKSEGLRIVFGHWSTLGVGEMNHVLSLDGGCLWGGSLVAVRLDSKKLKWHSLACQAACLPGKS
ncbi:MAG TPA: symmetrical bis(5'-nucleosyl)-tetraphosphatase [Candidatus Tenderia sp.]|nr:symmetrical bis(5'-nucleosyl)-tetraphosphatase [Candidatus Tenderia sp.]